jgi:hypothetical protein
MAAYTSPTVDSTESTRTDRKSMTRAQRFAAAHATSKHLEGQMGNLRGRCKLGFACARGEVSKAADVEIIGLRRADVVIVPFGGEQLQQLLADADRLDEHLAEMVIEAMMS